MGIRGTLLAVFFLGSLPFCFRRPFYGIALWMILAFLNPHAYAWGAATLPWAEMVILPTIAGTLIFVREGWSGLKRREALLVMALWVWFSITTIVSVNTPALAHHAADTLEKWQLVSKVFLVTLLTIPVVNTFERLRLLTIVVAGCFGAFVLKSLPFIILTGGTDKIYGPPNSMIADNNDLGLALNMTLPLFFFLAQSESKPWVKRLFGFLFVITIPAILFTYSRGALLGLLAVGSMMFLGMTVRQRILITPIILCGLLGAVLFAPDSWHERMKTISNYQEDASAQGRINAWKYATNLAADYPITGGGFATFTRRLYESYSPNGTGAILTAHSSYFQILAEHGYIGILLYLSVLGSCFFTASGIARRARFYGDQVVLNYANMFRFSIIGFAISSAFLSRAYFDYYYCIVSCIVILRHSTADRWADWWDEAGTKDEETGAGEPVFPTGNGAPAWE